MPRGPWWTAREIETLCDAYETAPYEELRRKLLGRSWYAIRGKALELGLSRFKLYGLTKPRPWTHEEVDFIISNRGRQTHAQMATALARKERTIAHKLHKLGLTTSKQLDPEPDKLTTEQAAYFSGLLDGDGCIWFTLHRNGYSELGVGIGMMNEEVILTVYNWLKAAGFHPGLDIRAGKHVRQVNLRRQRECLLLLERVLPFLIDKREKAHLVIRFCKLRLSSPHKAYSEEEQDIMRAVQCNQLRGKKPVL